MFFSSGIGMEFTGNRNFLLPVGIAVKVQFSSSLARWN